MPHSDAYIASLNLTLSAGDSTEHSHRHALKAYVESFAVDLTATNEPKRSAAGAPDYDVKQTRGHGALSIGKIEAKDISQVSRLTAIHSDSDRESPRTSDGEQLSRYRGAFENLLLTDYVEFRWYVRGDLRLTASLGSVESGRIIATPEGVASVEDLLGHFLAAPRQKIRTARLLAERLARLSSIIHDVIRNSARAGTATTATRGLETAFRETLLPDLTDDQFADMLAQTIAYGLFAARVQHGKSDDEFTRLTAGASIPRTNPFLRRLFGIVTGPDLEDEPYVGVVDDLAQLLNDADMVRILRDFGADKRDPIVHFYETFLGAYNPQLRDIRGVYYTPSSVVAFIVRSVDRVLQSRFSLPAGLADTGYVGSGDSRSHKVLVLDPAVGTGTFLYEVIDLVRQRFVDSGKEGLWAAYVRAHLLPRLFGFEIMMAPYAVAHLKLALQLGGRDLPEEEREAVAYDFATDERVGVFLTNALDPGEAHSTLPLGQFISDEANAASEVKTSKPLMVVLGNPPYQGQSANSSTRREAVGRDKNGRVRSRTVKTSIGTLLESYYQVDGAPLGEQNPKWLQDDYVKFIRLGQSRIDANGQGVLAFVTNHTYLDAPTFRGMRQSLLASFDNIYVLDLHGSLRRREKAPGGLTDENVFDQIQQGVCIAIFVKSSDSTDPAVVHYSEQWGTRTQKYDWLDSANLVDSPSEEFTPVSPFYSFRPEDPATRDEWLKGLSLTEIFPIYSTGIVTHRDSLVIDTSESRLRDRIDDFVDQSKSDAEVRKQYFGTTPRTTPTGIRYEAGDNRDWTLTAKRKLIGSDKDRGDSYQRLLYRPFDDRHVFYHKDAIDGMKSEVMRHMLRGPNLGLISARSNKSSIQDQFFVTSLMSEVKAGEATTGSVLFPLWLYPEPEIEAEAALISAEELQERAGRVPNLGAPAIDQIQRLLGLTLCDDDAGDLIDTFGPRDVLDYVYGVVHSRTYRVRYADFLRTDYPRIPITSDLELFRFLQSRGRRLAELHTLSADGIDGGMTAGPTPGSLLIDAIPASKRWTAGDGESGVSGIILNRDGARSGGPQMLPGVTEAVWDYQVGGHQVLKKWIDARVGDTLTYDEIEHLVKSVNSISQTIDVQDEIEEALLAEWPLA